MSKKSLEKSGVQYKRQRAFTLVELIITLVIGSLLLAWGIPNYRDLKNTSEVSAFANEVLYSFALARSEAIRRGTDVQVTATSAGNWEDGWITQALDELGTPVADLAVQEAISGNLGLSYTNNSFVFNNLGALTVVAPVVFELTNSYDTALSRNIVISPSGSTRVIKP